MFKVKADIVLKSMLETCPEEEQTIWFLAKWDALIQCPDSWTHIPCSCMGKSSSKILCNTACISVLDPRD